MKVTKNPPMLTKQKNPDKKITKRREGVEKSAGTTPIAAHYFTKFLSHLPAFFSFRPSRCRPSVEQINIYLSIVCPQAAEGSNLRTPATNLAYRPRHRSPRPSRLGDRSQPLRPLFDHSLTNLLKNSFLASKDFRFEQNGCRLKKPASGVYFDAFFAENFLEKPLRGEVAELLRLLKQLTPLTFLRNLEKDQADDDSDDCN